MPRIYKPVAVGPSTNKVAKPVQETKAPAAKPNSKENTEKKDGGDK